MGDVFDIRVSSSSLTKWAALRVQSRVLLPGTAFFEIASAAAVTLCNEAASLAPPAIASLALSSPKVLSQGAMDRAQNTVTCAVDCQTGSLTISSAGSDQAHVSCRITICRGKIAEEPSRTDPAASRQGLVAAALAAAWKLPGSHGHTVAQLAGVVDAAAVGVGEYIAHPAPADATLHLGAVANKPGMHFVHLCQARQGSSPQSISQSMLLFEK